MSKPGSIATIGSIRGDVVAPANTNEEQYVTFTVGN